MKNGLIRVAILVAVAVYLVHPFLTVRFAGGTDARWYAQVLREFLDQERSGHFPVLMGQGWWDWNGGVHPFRSAPMFFYVAGLWDLLTFRSLGLFTLQHLAALTSALAGALGFYAAAAAFLPRRRWEAMLLAILYVGAPVWLGVLYRSEAYMTFMTLGVLPLVLYGNARAATSDDGSGFAPLAAGIALMWMCHPPVALLTTLASAFVQGGKLLFDPRPGRRLGGALKGAALFAVFGAFYFASMSELPSFTRSPRPDAFLLAGFALTLAGTVRALVFRERWVGVACGLAGALLLRSISFPWLVWMAIAAGLVAAVCIVLRGLRLDPAPRASAIVLPCLLVAAGLADVALGPGRPERNMDMLAAVGVNAAQAARFFLPLSPTHLESDLQPGLGLWIGLGIVGAGFFRVRSTSVRLFFAAVVLLLMGVVRIPWAGDFLVGYIPLALATIASFPMVLRLMPVIAGFLAMTCVLRLAARSDEGWRRTGPLLLLAAAAVWCLAQSRFLVQVGREAVATEQQSRDILLSENVATPHFNYDLLPMPTYFWEGVVDPRLEFRLRDEGGSVYFGPDDVARTMEAAGSTSLRLVAWRKPGEGPNWLRFNPGIDVAPGENLLLRFRFDPARDPAGYLMFRGEHGYREIYLPYAGLSGGFGVGPEQSHVISLWNSTPTTEHYALMMSRQPGNNLNEGDDLADVAVSHYVPSRSPVDVLSFDPLVVEVDAPRAGWLETPRVFLPGYAARLDGRAVPVRSSSQKLVMIRLPAGKHRVELRTHLTLRLAMAGLVSLVSWVGWISALFRARRRPASAPLPLEEAPPPESEKAGLDRLHTGLVRLGVGVAAAAVLAFYAWTIATSGGAFDAADVHNQYYPELARGLRAGHLYMDLPVDPHDPYRLDVSLYQGHYYLYFGVAPVAVLFFPYLLLTGHSLPEPAAAVIFSLAAFGFGTAWWLGVRRRFFPALGAGWTALGVLAIGLCSAVPSTLRRPMFYEVAILAGFAFSALTLWALTRALHRPDRRTRWLVLAGLAAGLAFGSRANLAPAELILLAAGCAAGAGWGLGRFRFRAFLASVKPAAIGFGLIALALGAYNDARFGSPFEFGHRYQLGLNPHQMFHRTNVAYNAEVYYLLPPSINGYFPFVAPALAPPPPPDYVGREHAHGEWIWLPLALLALAGAFALRRERPAGWGALIALPLILFAVNFPIVCAAGSRANRYMLDFHPFLVLATLAALGPLLAGRHRLAPLVRWLAALLLAAAVLFNLAASVEAQGFAALVRPQIYQRLADRANRLVWPWLRSEAAAVGDRRVSIRWPRAEAQSGGLYQPLLVSGTAAFDDVLWVGFGPGGRARFAYEHGDYGMAVGEWFPIKPGGVSTVDLSGAFLLPGVDHPWFDGRVEDERLALKNRLRVAVDGTVRFDRAVPSFDSSPRLQRWGYWRAPDTPELYRFTGEIGRPEVVAPSLDSVRDALFAHGAIRLTLLLPKDSYGTAEAILQSGPREAFDTLGIEYVNPTTVRLIHDSLGSGAATSDPIAVDYDQPQRLEIEAPFASDGILWEGKDPVPTRVVPSHLAVRWNGRPVFVSKIALHPASPGSIIIGDGVRQCSDIRMMYTGHLVPSPRREPLGLVGLGRLDFHPADLGFYGDDRGVLLRFSRGDGESADLVWRRQPGGVQVGWVDADAAQWSSVLKEDAIPQKLSLDISSFRATPDVWADMQDEVEVEVRGDGVPLLSAPTDLFSQGPVESEAILAPNWTGSALAAASLSYSRFASMPAELPGRIRIRFRIPTAIFASGQPLLEAGRPTKADSIYLRRLADGRYVLGLDHWGIAGYESKPIALSLAESHVLLVEMGSLFAKDSFPKDLLRLTLDGKPVLEVRTNLYTVHPGEIWIGRNPLGMSTSDTAFGGELISVRTRLAR